MENTSIVWKDKKRTLFGLPLSFTTYSLSEERLFIERGFFKTTEDEVRLYRILDLKLERSFGQKIFKLGTIQVFSSDKSLGNFEIKNIKNPKQVKELLSEYVEKERDAKRVVSREFMDTEDDDDMADMDE